MPTSEQLDELYKSFPNLATDNDCGEILTTDIPAALKVCEVDIPGYQLREHLQKYGKLDSLTHDQFSELADELTSQKHAETSRWKNSIGSPTGTYQIQSTARHGVDEIFHTIRIELINLVVPDTIDDRVLNKKNLNIYTKLENLTLCLMSSQAIGCNIVNIHSDDLLKGRPHLVLGLLWQIIRIGLFRSIDLVHVPGLSHLLRTNETIADLQQLKPEQILIRWVNYHLNRAGANRSISNFTFDVRDSVVYAHLLHQIAPNPAEVNLSPLKVESDENRADAVLSKAEKISCREFVRPDDVVNGNYKLNLAFVANLFNNYPALPEPDPKELPVLEAVNETREEKTYRNWINSLGVNPFLNYLYSDLRSGLMIFQLYDCIKPGVVDWKRVVIKFRRLQAMMDRIQNCNYAIELGKRMSFSLIGIQGKDIYDGNRTLTLALLWQLMRAYTLAILAQCTQADTPLITDQDIINWANRKLKSAGKSSQIRSFRDLSIVDARPVIDLIDAIRPGAIDYSLVKPRGPSESHLANAKYAITSGRKIGARIYALPEDIVEVKPKMCMTVFACLMALDLVSNSN